MLYTFEEATGNGVSKCLCCGSESWDCFMWKVKEFNNKRVCSECKKKLEKVESLYKAYIDSDIVSSMKEVINNEC